MRGKAAACVFLDRGVRITPAYAGKSLVILLKILLIRDHPRLCGEKPVGR